MSSGWSMIYGRCHSKIVQKNRGGPWYRAFLPGKFNIFGGVYIVKEGRYAGNDHEGDTNSGFYA
jgi:hypothetical protein